VGDYFPDSTPKELARKDDLCRGAEPFVHSHFFTGTGEFGSLTEDLEQVDDGPYEIIDDSTLRIGTEPGVRISLRDSRRHVDPRTRHHQRDDCERFGEPA
jgi:hypothetical protein